MMPSTQATVDLRIPLARMAQRKIFFGHQSVGADVVWGLGALAENLAVPINIVETRTIGDLDGAGSALDPATAKLCYVDVTRDGGHLNRRGRKLAAMALVCTLGRLI